MYLMLLSLLFGFMFNCIKNKVYLLSQYVKILVGIKWNEKHKQRQSREGRSNNIFTTLKLVYYYPYSCTKN